LKAFRLRTVHRIDWVIHKTGAMRSSAAQDAQSLLFVKDLFLIGKFFLTILDKLTAPYAAPHACRVCHMQLMEGYGRLGEKRGFREYRRMEFVRTCKLAQGMQAETLVTAGG